MVAGTLDGVADEQRDEPAAALRWLRAAAAEQQGRSFLWSPVALTFGIWLYFGLQVEPGMTLTGGFSALAALLLWLGRRVSVLFLVALVASGFVLAKLRTEMTATPLLRATTAEVLVTGRIADVERASRGRLNIILEPASIEGIADGLVPVRLRLSSTPKLGQPIMGTRVSFKARLSPLPTPVQPGGFDYGRRLWFESIGGTGRITTPIILLESTIPIAARFDAALADLRSAMCARIHAVLDDPYASFAEALITGERSTIPTDLNQSLLVSGLFHILSISGLHMWLVVGGVFWTVRAALALVPRLALRHPIKKWAAAAALAMGLFYMLLADSGVATQRSYIMIAVVFFAVMVDRPALSTRNLAIAAIIILLFEPEAAVEASFQMSFLAVLGLVAFYEAWSRYTAARDGEQTFARHWMNRTVAKLAKGTAASVLTTLVAGGMSTIPAAFHFGRIAPYSLIANGIAIPVIGFVVMPFALLGAVLMPLGLETLPLWIMGEGLRLVIVISDWVAGFSGANVVAAQPSHTSVFVLAFGAVILCLVAGWLRLAGIAVMAAGLFLMSWGPRGPDILIERTGQNAAFANEQSLLVPAYPRRARFTVEKWLQVRGDEATPAEAAKRPGWTCAENRCDATLKGKRIAYVSKAETQSLDCNGIDILITDFPLRRRCGSVPLRIDRFDLWRKGAHALRIETSEIIVETARDSQGQRPWVVEPQARTTPYVPQPSSNSD
jgi:competence protein ComEC